MNSTLFRDDYINVLQYNHLVYCAHRISASSFYYNLLLNSGWQKIKFSEIDWESNHVFGFIMNPYERTIQGIANDIHANPQHKKNLNLVFHFNILFSFHCLPLNLTYGSLFDKIDWIPLDLVVTDDNTSILIEPITMLQKLLKKYDLSLDQNLINDMERQSLSRNLELKERQVVVAKVRKKHTNVNGIGNCALWLGLEKDFEVYNAVVKHTYHWNDSWDDISWLNNFKKT